MRMKQFDASPVLAAYLVLFAGIGVPVAARAQSQPATGVVARRDVLLPRSSRKRAPDFRLQDAQGHTIQMSALRGRVVLLDFWATWCGGCKLEIPWFMEFDSRYKAHGLSVIGVAMDDEGWKVVRPFLALEKDPETGGRTAMQYPVVLGSAGLAKAYGLTSMPRTVLIDRDGKIALAHTGVVDKSAFEAHVQQLLK